MLGQGENVEALLERVSEKTAPKVDARMESIELKMEKLIDQKFSGMKKRFDEKGVFEQYGMICLVLDDAVVDGHVESLSWDQIRRTAKMKLAAE